MARLLPACELGCHSPVNDPIRCPPGVSRAPARWPTLFRHTSRPYILACCFFSSATWSSSHCHMSTFNYSHLVLIVMIFLSISKASYRPTSAPLLKCIFCDWIMQQEQAIFHCTAKYKELFNYLIRYVECALTSMSLNTQSEWEIIWKKSIDSKKGCLKHFLYKTFSLSFMDFRLRSEI